MNRVIGYTYEADVHCVDCTVEDSVRMKLDHNHPYAMGESFKDDNGVEYDFVDREGNLIHPVFEFEAGERCGDCFKELK